jgi:hypothetical protein
MLNAELKVMLIIDGVSEKQKEMNVINVVKIVFVNDLGKNIH